MVRIEKTKKRGDRKEDERRDGWEKREREDEKILILLPALSSYLCDGYVTGGH
jgi:hypothetical protein